MRIVLGGLLCMILIAGCVVVEDRGANAPATPVVTAPPDTRPGQPATTPGTSPGQPDTPPSQQPPGDGASTETPGETPGDTHGDTHGEQPGETAFSVTLERTACFGACPMYTVTVDQGGAVTFDGKRFVASTGNHSARVDAQALSRLRQAVEASDFFALKDCYCERNVTDLPSAIVTVNLGDRKKTVRHYAGDRSAPPALIELQEQIDRLASTERWIKPPVQ